MHIKTSLYIYSYFIAYGTAARLVCSIMVSDKQNPDWKTPGFAVLYFIFLTLLDFRSTYNNEYCKRKYLKCGIKNDNVFWRYLKGMFCRKTKVTPIKSPFFTEVCKAGWYIIVWILFPPRVALGYVWIEMWMAVAHICINDLCVNDVVDADTLIYNGRRYEPNWIGVYHTEIQDEEQNVLYFPTFGIYGLISRDDE